MNGVEIIEPQPTSFLARLLGRRPKENAFLAINNVIATLPIYHISETAVAGCLTRYGTTHAEGKSRLLNIYSQVLDHFIKDLCISDDEADQLRHLASIFKLTSDEVSQIHTAIVYPHYEKATQLALKDNELTDEENKSLDGLCAKLRIPEAAGNEIYRKLMTPIYSRAMSSALADKMLSPEEEAELERLAKSLKLNIRFNEQTNLALERARKLWRVAQGQLPILAVPINLQFNERCSAQIEGALHYEPGRLTRGIGYSGFSTSYSAFGIRFRSGIINTQRLSSETMLLRGAGTLYFTNRRLLFDGSSKSTSIPLGKIIALTFYSDGLRVEKESGKDQIFTFSGDMEIVRLIADYLMSSYRQDTAERSAKSSRPRPASRPYESTKTRRDTGDQQEAHRSPHEVLQVSVNASMEEIKVAYRSMASMYHPDKVAYLAPEFREMAERKMKEINIAYDALKTGK